MTEPSPAMFISAQVPTVTASIGQPNKPSGKAVNGEQVPPHQSAENASKPASQVHLSEKAKQALAEQTSPPTPKNDEETIQKTTKPAGTKELSDEEKQQVTELKARDGEVRAHEHAHVAAAGGNTKGGIKYETQRGPDGKEYAVGGHVSIDTAPISGDPRRTIQKAQTVRRAALAPNEPSGADRQVAAAAANTISEARSQLAAEEQANVDEPDGEPNVEVSNANDNAERSSVRSSYARAAYAKSAA